MPQRAALHSKIWKISNELRGQLEGWDFRNYVLGLLFYRFISEDLSRYFDDENTVYANLEDTAISDDLKSDTIKTKGYFIYHG